jgi:RNA polymerase sigma-70 factor (ECF subfamily)
MAESPVTRPSLLVRLRDPGDGPAWAEFVEIYAPLVYGFGRKHGLQDADAADLTQEVLRAVARAAGRLVYDPARGSFRGWLFTVVRNKLRNFLAAAGRRERGSGDSDLHDLLCRQPAREDEAALWEREHQRRLFHWAAEQVRPRVQETTWQAFWRTAVDGHDPRQVAADVGLSLAAVYLARSRVMARLKEEVRRVEGE